MYSTLSTINTTDWGALEQGTKPPTAPRAPQHQWLPTAPGVYSRCVCVCSLLCVCTLDGINADHKFWVWVTILVRMSCHFHFHGLVDATDFLPSSIPSHEHLTIIMVHTLFIHLYTYLSHTYLVYTPIVHNIPVHTKLSIVINLYIQFSSCILLFIIFYYLCFLFCHCHSVALH